VRNTPAARDAVRDLIAEVLFDVLEELFRRGDDQPDGRVRLVPVADKVRVVDIRDTEVTLGTEQRESVIRPLAFAAELFKPSTRVRSFASLKASPSFPPASK
jgi:hypothetical protein